MANGKVIKSDYEIEKQKIIDAKNSIKKNTNVKDLDDRLIRIENILNI